MKTRKLIAKLGRLLEGGKGLERRSLQELLVRLEEKERQLRGELSETGDAAAVAKILRKIWLLRAQQEKGREALKNLP